MFKKARLEEEEDKAASTRTVPPLPISLSDRALDLNLSEHALTFLSLTHVLLLRCVSRGMHSAVEHFCQGVTRVNLQVPPRERLLLLSDSKDKKEECKRVGQRTASELMFLGEHARALRFLRMAPELFEYDNTVEQWTVDLILRNALTLECVEIPCGTLIQPCFWPWRNAVNYDGLRFLSRILVRQRRPKHRPTYSIPGYWIHSSSLW